MLLLLHHYLVLHKLFISWVLVKQLLVWVKNKREKKKLFKTKKIILKTLNEPFLIRKFQLLAVEIIIYLILIKTNFSELNKTKS